MSNAWSDRGHESIMALEALLKVGVNDHSAGWKQSTFHCV